MIEVSQTYKDTLATGMRNFNAIIYITLEDGTHLPVLTNANLRAFSIDDAVSDDNKFTMLGSTIINQCKLTIDNMSDEYWTYNFKYADVVVYIDYPLIDSTTERIRKGTFYVDTDSYVGGTVELTCFDNMAKFDRDYALSNLQYPATIRDIILDACSVCNVPFSYTEIPNGDFLIPARPHKEQTTFRQVLGWACQIIGCFARCNTLGQLEVKWCDTNILADVYGSLDGGTFDLTSPYSSGTIADGGSFNPWNVGYVISSSSLSSQSESHNFYYNYSQDVAIEDTVITGITITVDTELFLNSTNKLALGIYNGNLIFEKTDDESVDFYINDNGELVVSYTNADDSFSIDENGSVILETESSIERDDTSDNSDIYSTGSEGHVITIEKNELITAEIAQRVVTLLGDKLVGMRFRKASTNHMGDPTIEAGDIAVLWDTKNRSYPIIVTRTEFAIGKQQKTVCGVESPSKNVATRYTETAQAYLRIRDQLRQEKTSRELAIDTLAERLSASSGLYSTIETTSSGNIYYLHDRPDLAESQIIWKMTAEAWGVSSDGGQTWNGGMTVDGDTIVRILSATGIDADWIKTGMIQDRSGLNYINLDNGNLQFRSATSKAYMTFNDAAITTYNKSDGLKGASLAQNKLYFYNWGVDGVLAGYLTSTITTGSSNQYGVQLVKPYDAHRVALGYRQQSSDSIYTGLALIGVATDDPVLYSYLRHVFRKSIELQANVNGEYKKFFDLELFGTADSTIKKSTIWSNYLQLTTDSYGKILLASSTVRNTLGLSAPEYSDVTIDGDVSIRGGFDLIFPTVGSKINFVYGSDTLEVFASKRSGEVYFYSSGGLACAGTKNRIVKTKDYGEVALNAYETTTPYFGDIGSAKLDENGICYVELDKIFLETVVTDMEYCVFLQKEGPGDLWVANKQKTYFEINGTPNLKFSWEVKARQLGYEKNRLERTYADDESALVNYGDLGFAEYAQYVNRVSNIGIDEDA